MILCFDGLLNKSFFSINSLNPFCSLNERICEIAKKSHEDLSDTAIKDLESAFMVSKWRLPSLFGVKERLKSVPKKVMQQFLSIIAEKKDVSSYLKDYIELFSHDELVVFLEQSDEVLKAQMLAFFELKSDPMMQSFLSKEGKRLYQEVLYSSRYFLFSILDATVAALEFNEFNSDELLEGNKYLARERLKFYKKMMYAPLGIFQFFSLYLRSFSAGLAAATLSLTIPVVVFVYNKYFKSCPKKITSMDNFRLQRLDPVYPRQKFIQKIHDTFASEMGVLLVGDSGVGKTMLAHSLIQEVLKGRSCQFIKNPQIFGCNASVFNSNIFELSFDRLRSQLKDHQKEIIFFFDEFASFFRPDKMGVSLENALKTFSGEFRYIMGATTTEEYNKYIKNNKTIANEETNEPRRFRVIHLDAMDETELEKALDYQLRQKRLGLDVEEGFFQLLAKDKKVHVASALMESAVKKMTELSFETTAVGLSKLKEERDELARKIDGGLVDLLEKYKSVRLQIINIEEEQRLKRVKFQAMKQLESSYQKFKDKRYTLLFKNMDQKAIDCWLKNEAAVKMSQALIQKKRQELKLPLSFNKELVGSLT